MGQSSPKHGQRSAVFGQLSLGERCARFLRQMHPARTADNVAADTGLKAETIAKMLQRQSDPSGLALALMIAAYGPDFLGAVLPRAPAWLQADRRAADVTAAIAELDAIKARLLANRPDAG